MKTMSMDENSLKRRHVHEQWSQLLYFFLFSLIMLILSDNENKAVSGPLVGKQGSPAAVLNLPKPLMQNSHPS